MRFGWVFCVVYMCHELTNRQVGVSDMHDNSGNMQGISSPMSALRVFKKA